MSFKNILKEKQYKKCHNIYIKICLIVYKFIIIYNNTITKIIIINILRGFFSHPGYNFIVSGNLF